MAQDLFLTRHGSCRIPQSGERESLRLYLKFADRLLAGFDKWRDIDRFYYIPVALDMTYSCSGYATAMAFPPYFIGTILRNSLEHPELFSAECKCGHRAYGYSYNGSPPSGRVDISHACPCCGARMQTEELGWKVRSEALRGCQEAEKTRLEGTRQSQPGFEPADIRELLKFIGVSDEELILPTEK